MESVIEQPLRQATVPVTMMQYNDHSSLN